MEFRGFEDLVKTELNKIRFKHKDPVHGYHEGHGLIMEELDEFWDEVRKKTSKRDQLNALRELVQIAANAQRVAEDLGLVAYLNVETQTVQTPTDGDLDRINTNQQLVDVLCK